VIAIRLIRDGELETLAHIFTRAVHESAVGHYTPDQLHAWAPGDVAGFVARHSPYDGFVAEIDGMIAGFSDLGADGTIDMLYVSPDFGRRGVAGALLAHVETVARQKAIARLRARVSLTARPVFARAGFAVVAPLMVERAGQRFQTFRMEKQL
jgi:putative acetyltransferase